MPSNMDLAASLAEKIKVSDLGDWIEESDLREIGKEAIKLAFFKDQMDSYNRSTGPSAMISAMRSTFEEQIKELMKPVIEELCKDEDFITKLSQHMIAFAPQAMENAARAIMGTAIYQARMGNEADLQGKISEVISRMMVSTPTR